MKGKGIIFAKAYCTFDGIHANILMISKVTEAMIADHLTLIISLTYNYLYIGEIRIVPETDNILI